VNVALSPSTAYVKTNLSTFVEQVCITQPVQCQMLASCLTPLDLLPSAQGAHHASCPDLTPETDECWLISAVVCVAVGSAGPAAAQRVRWSPLLQVQQHAPARLLCHEGVHMQGAHVGHSAAKLNLMIDMLKRLGRM
jgi:hypothetical protein